MQSAVIRRVYPVYALFILSGACALVYETVWMRLLAYYCGNTTFAAAAVLTAFMAGLGLGSWIIGRRADATRRPLRLYAILEMLIALYALLLPTFIDLFKPGFGLLTRSLEGHFFPQNLGRFLLVLLLLLFPTAMMGGTFPALVKALGGEGQTTARRMAVLYAMNTLGGAIGTAVAGFWFIGAFGLGSTQHLTVLANLCVAAAAWLLSRQGDRPTPAAGASVPLAPPTRAPLNFLLFCFVLAGFAALAYEVACLRLLIFLLPYGYNNVYVFSTVLITFLFGIGVGSLLISRVIESLQNPLRTVGVAQIVLALSTALSLPLLTLLLRLSPTGEIPEFGTRALYSFLFSAAVLILPTGLMGAVLPLYGRLGMVEYSSLGTDVGRIYAANTAGNIAGAFLGGFVLIPLLGLQKSFAVISVTYALVGLAILGAAEGVARQRGYRRLTMLVGAAGIVLVVMVPFRRMITPEPPYELAYYREGISSTLMVLQDTDQSVLQINDFVAAGTDYEHLRNQRMMGFLPYLVHAGPTRSALVICLGTGTTAGALAVAPGVERVTVVEIDEQVPGALSFFSRENLALARSPKATIIIEDGRAFMEFDRRSYDIVTGEPLHPKRSGTVSLYTREYYEHGRKRLAANGVFAQWIPYHALTLVEMRAIMRTFSDVFPHVALWMGEQLIMLGSDVPIAPGYRQLAGRMQPGEVGAPLREVDCDNPLRILSGFLLWDDSFRSFADAGAPLTDDLPSIEFSRDHRTYNLPRIFFQARRNFLDSVEDLDPREPEVEAVWRGEIEKGLGIAALLDDRTAEAMRRFEAALRLAPDDRRAARWLAQARSLLQAQRASGKTAE